MGGGFKLQALGFGVGAELGFKFRVYAFGLGFQVKLWFMILMQVSGGAAWVEASSYRLSGLGSALS